MTTTTIDLQFTDARDEEKLFATAFTRDDALDCAAIVEKALPEIANLGAHDTRFLRGVPGSIVQLEGIVAVHPDLVMYCVMMKLELNVYRQNASTYQQQLSAVLCDAINGKIQELLPVYVHMLRVWPHNKRWSAVNEILAYTLQKLMIPQDQLGEVLDAFCGSIIRQQDAWTQTFDSVLTDPLIWETAFNALLNCARKNPERAGRAVFKCVFYFLRHCMMDNAAGRGIAVPEDVYTNRRSILRQVFQALPPQVQVDVRILRTNILTGSPRAFRCTSTMDETTENESCVQSICEALRTSDLERARAILFSDQFNPMGARTLHQQSDPRLYALLGELLNQPAYNFNKKQYLCFKLYSAVKQPPSGNDSPECRQAARQALEGFQPGEAIPDQFLAKCNHVMLLSLNREDNRDQMVRELRELIRLHDGLDSQYRSNFPYLIDGGAWKKLLQNYDAQDALAQAVQEELRQTDLNSVEEAVKILLLVNSTFNPAGHETNLLRRAPHRAFVDFLRQVFEIEDGRVTREARYVSRVNNAALSAIRALLTPDNYRQTYRPILDILYAYWDDVGDWRDGGIRADQARRNRADVYTITSQYQ